VCGEGGKIGTANHISCGTGERRPQKLRMWHTMGRLDWEWLRFQQLNFSKASSLRSSTLCHQASETDETARCSGHSQLIKGFE